MSREPHGSGIENRTLSNPHGEKVETIGDLPDPHDAVRVKAVLAVRQLGDLAPPKLCLASIDSAPTSLPDLRLINHDLLRLHDQVRDCISRSPNSSVRGEE